VQALPCRDIAVGDTDLESCRAVSLEDRGQLCEELVAEGIDAPLFDTGIRPKEIDEFFHERSVPDLERG
jgi:hypothetical protein